MYFWWANFNFKLSTLLILSRNLKYNNTFTQNPFLKFSKTYSSLKIFYKCHFYPFSLILFKWTSLTTSPSTSSSSLLSPTKRVSEERWKNCNFSSSSFHFCHSHCFFKLSSGPSYCLFIRKRKKRKLHLVLEREFRNFTSLALNSWFLVRIKLSNVWKCSRIHF